MAKTMTPSTKTTTDKQVNKAVSNFRALLEKHAEELDSKAVQIVLGQTEFAEEMFGVFRRRVEAISEMIVRRVKVNRSRNPREAIAATNRAEYLNNEAVDNMPREKGEEEDVFFFPLKKFTGVADVQKMLDEHGLKPDPYAVAAVNEADPTFTDKYPNGTQWVDKDGKHCYLAFHRWHDDERSVLCHRDEYGWFDYWWVGGVRK